MVSKPMFRGPSQFPDDEDRDGPSSVGLFTHHSTTCVDDVFCLYDSWLCPLEGHTAMGHKLLNV
jgi:hypothetical protein